MLSQHSHSMLVLLRWLVCVFWLLGWSKKCRPESHAVVVFCSIKQLWHAVIWDPLMVHSGFRVACYLPLSLQQSCKWTQDPWNLNLFLLNYFSIGYNQPKFLCWYLLIVEERKNRPQPIYYICSFAFPVMYLHCKAGRLQASFWSQGIPSGGFGIGQRRCFFGVIGDVCFIGYWFISPISSNPFCKWFWSGFWEAKHLLIWYLEH